MRWSLTWGDKTWSEDDLTVAHVADIVRSSGSESWEALNPAQSPIRLIYMLAAFIAVDEDRDVLVVLQELRGVKFATVLDALGLTVDDD